MTKFFTLTWLLLFLLIGVPPLVAQQEYNEKQAIRKAQNFLQDNLYHAALEILEGTIKNYPKSANLNFLLGKTYFLSGQKHKATTYLEAAYKNNTNPDAECRLYYARALHYSMQFDAAIAILQKEKTRPNISADDLYLINILTSQCKYGKELIANPLPNVQIENLGTNINTAYPDFAPVISADESVLLFTSRRAGSTGNQTDRRDNLHYEDIYISKNENGQWTPAQNIGSPINYELNDACIALSADGQTLYLLRSDNGGDIFMSKLNGTQWGVPVNMGEPINSDYWEPSICVNADGTFVIFSSNRPGGFGGRDLYYCYRKKDGKWSAAVNAGPTLNTPGDEDSPYLHPDGQTLYFSSNGHRNMGGFDVFKSQFKGDGTWTKPINLGFPVNTTDDDIYFVLSASGKHGYYASSGRTDGLGHRDIYRIIFPEPEKKIITHPNIETYQPQSYVTILKGTVYDSLTRKPLQAALLVIDNERNDTIATMYSNQSTGRYLLTLPAGRNYGICAHHNGYLYFSDHVEIQELNRYQEVIKDVPLLPLAKGSKFVLKNIFFDFDKNTLRPTSKAELSRLYKILKDNPKMRVQIAGHTDDVGDNEYNRKLSEARAQAVVDYLIKQGIPSDRMEAAGYGETQPIDTNQTPAGRQNNRRTELEIISF